MRPASVVGHGHSSKIVSVKNLHKMTSSRYFDDVITSTKATCHGLNSYIHKINLVANLSPTKFLSKFKSRKILFKKSKKKQ